MGGGGGVTQIPKIYLTINFFTSWSRTFEVNLAYYIDSGQSIPFSELVVSPLLVHKLHKNGGGGVE